MVREDPTLDPSSPEALRRLLAKSRYEITTPMIAVVDTSFLRTGLRNHLKNGHAPHSLVAIRSEAIDAFIEGETLREMFRKIPKFAKQFRVTELELKEFFLAQWLPNIKVIELPLDLRELDERSLAVRDRDEDDFAAASLAALLSPCILLTHDLDFAALGVSRWEQGIFAICLVEDVNDGNAGLQAAVMIPAAPVFALGVVTKKAYDRFGPVALGVAGLAVAGVALLYLKQPPDRRNTIKSGAAKASRTLLEIYGEAAAALEHAKRELRQNLVPPPEDMLPVSAILRALAITPTSLSAQQLHDELESTFSFDVHELRAYLHGYKEMMFFEERRGGFRLGIPFEVWLNGQFEES